MAEQKPLDLNDVQCYIATNADNSKMFGMAVTPEKLIEIVMERFDLDDSEILEFKSQNQMVARPIVGIPVKNIVEVEHRSVLASQETMQNLLYDSYNVRKERDVIENYESMAEVVANVLNENSSKTKPTPDDAMSILKQELDDVGLRTPCYPINQRTGDDNKNFLIFSDGSRLDMRGSTLIAEPNVEERIMKLEKEHRHKFASELTNDVRLYRDPSYELSLSSESRFRR